MDGFFGGWGVDGDEDELQSLIHMVNVHVKRKEVLKICLHFLCTCRHASSMATSWLTHVQMLTARCMSDCFVRTYPAHICPATSSSSDRWCSEHRDRCSNPLWNGKINMNKFLNRGKKRSKRISILDAFLFYLQLLRYSGLFLGSSTMLRLCAALDSALKLEYRIS